MADVDSSSSEAALLPTRIEGSETPSKASSKILQRQLGPGTQSSDKFVRDLGRLVLAPGRSRSTHCNTRCLFADLPRLATLDSLVAIQDGLLLTGATNRVI